MLIFTDWKYVSKKKIKFDAQASIFYILVNAEVITSVYEVQRIKLKQALLKTMIQDGICYLV